MGLFSSSKYSLIKEYCSVELWDWWLLDIEDHFFIDYSILQVYKNDVYGVDNRSGPNKEKVAEGNNLEELIKRAEDYNKEQQEMVVSEMHKQLVSGEVDFYEWPFPVSPEGV